MTQAAPWGHWGEPPLGNPVEELLGKHFSRDKVLPKLLKKETELTPVSFSQSSDL